MNLSVMVNTPGLSASGLYEAKVVPTLLIPLDFSLNEMYLFDYK